MGNANPNRRFRLVYLLPAIVAFVLVFCGIAAWNLTQASNGNHYLPGSIALLSERVKADAPESADANAAMDLVTRSIEGENGESVEVSYVSNTLLVSVDSSSAQNDLKAAVEKQGVKVDSLSMVSNNLFDDKSLVSVEYTGEKGVPELAEALVNSGIADIAEPDYIQTICESEAANVPSDSIGGQLQSLQINDPKASTQWHLDAIGAYDAWEAFSDSSNVCVAVIDSGVDYDHPDLAGNLVDSRFAKNTYTGSTGYAAVNDLNGHGTHVSGIISAITNNGVGVSGVSYNSKILPIKVTAGSSGSMTVADTIKALDYVRACSNGGLNVKVVNMSLGGYTYSSAYESAISSVANAGIIICAAAGNDGISSAHYPSAYSGAIGVSALMQIGSSVYFDSGYSNYGSYVDISAPGTNVYSAIPDGKYGSKTGTSMATPVVSGAAAMLFAAGEPNITSDEVKAALYSSATDLGPGGKDVLYGNGAVNLSGALSEVQHNVGYAVIEDITKQTYTGSSVCPEPSVTLNGKLLTKNVDYTLSYKNNIDAGSAEVVVRGIGAYSGTAQKIFIIDPVPALNVQTEASSCTYTGKQLTPKVTVKVDGNTLTEYEDFNVSYGSNINAGTGSYIVTFTKNYTGFVPGTFVISPMRVSVPEQAESIVYDGTPHTYIVESDCYQITGSSTETNAGQYVATINLKNSNYVWEDGSSDEVIIQWSISPKVVEAPSAVEGLIYTETDQTGVLPGEGYTLTGNVSSEKGKHTAIAKLLSKANYRWSDGTTKDKEIEWFIGDERYIDVPQAASLVYNGTEQQGVANGEGYTVSGDIKEVNAGSYESIVSLVPGYHWNGESDGDLTITWSIEKAPINPPSADTFEFDGSRKGISGVSEKKPREIASVSDRQAYLTESGDLYICDLEDSNTGERRGLIKVLSDIASCSLGSGHSAAITKSGDLYTWGIKDRYILGEATAVDDKYPMKIMSNVVSCSLGTEHSAAVTKSGDLYIWGHNDYGQLGDGTTTNSAVPKKVMSDVASCSLGFTHSAAVTKTGDLYTWGNNDHGQLGDGTTTNSAVPKKVMSDVASCSLGLRHSAAVTKSGDLYTWGWNNSCQLGTVSNSTEICEYPAKVMSDVTSCSLGSLNSAAVTTSGDLYTWGTNNYGLCGNGSISGMTTKPNKIMSNVASCSLGLVCSSAVTTSGDLYTWGSNQYKQINGYGSASYSSKPYKVKSDVSSSSIGAYHSAAVTTSGDMYIWGTNDYGQLDLPSWNFKKILSNVASFSLGKNHSGALTKFGGLYMWGSNDNGQLGDGTTTDSATPKYIMSNVVSFSLGEFHSGALTKSGDLYMWGSNSSGQIGYIGTYTYCTSPYRMMSDVVSFSLGKKHSSAVTKSGDLLTWGDNYNNQLGRKTSSYMSDRALTVLHNVAAVSLGDYHSVAVAKSGKLYAWGSNSYGQLGDGTTTNSTTPEPKLIMSNMASCSAGANHSAAISNNGVLYTWGRNDCGQLGDGTMTDSATPKRIMSNIASCSAGNSRTVATTRSGSFYIWGKHMNSLLYGLPGSDVIESPTEVFGGLAGNALYVTDDVNTCFGVNTNEYAAVLEPGPNYYWADGTTEAKTVNWSISPKKIGLPDFAPLTYNGDEQECPISGEGFVISGQTKAVDAGSYNATLDLDGSNYIWSDGSTDPKTVTWSIDPQTVEIPKGVALPYTGKSQIGIQSDGRYYTLSGSLVASKIGRYSATATLVDDSNYKWEDGSTDSKNIEWEITARSYDMSDITFSDEEIEYDGNKHSIEISGSLPDGLSVRYENNDNAAVGEHKVKAVFESSDSTYILPDLMEATLTIKREQLIFLRNR